MEGLPLSDSLPRVARPACAPGEPPPPQRRRRFVRMSTFARRAVMSNWYRRFCVAVVAAVLSLASVPVQAQSAPGSDIEWQEGPGTGRIGDIAEIRIPEG